MSNKSSVIVILNGASSSGKTLTAKALVKLLNSNCILTGLDDIMERDKPFGVEGHETLAGIRRAFKIMRFQFTDGRLKLFKKVRLSKPPPNTAGIRPHFRGGGPQRRIRRLAAFSARSCPCR